jgi:hypothetical protein
MDMNWKRALVIGVGWGLGTAAALAVMVAFYSWNQNRAKPWDKKAISSEFEGIRTEGDAETFAFYFTFENHTSKDLNITSADELLINARIHDSQSLMLLSDEYGHLDFPIFVPQNSRSRVIFHMNNYHYPSKTSQPKTHEERERYQTEMATYVTKEMSNLDGFEIFDKIRHYEIVLPGGWKSNVHPADSATEPTRAPSHSLWVLVDPFSQFGGQFVDRAPALPNEIIQRPCLPGSMLWHKKYQWVCVEELQKPSNLSEDTETEAPYSKPSKM